MNKKLFFTGTAAYTALLALSILFYNERMLFADSAYELFYIIKDNTFAIQHFRFGAMLTHVFPWLAFKAGLSLQSIMMAASTGFIVYYFLCYLTTGLILKRYDLALVILLGNILFVSDTFYWIQSELPQGIALLMVTMAFITSPEVKKTNVLNCFVIVSALITLAFFHPLMLFPFLFCIFFFLIDGETLPLKKASAIVLFYLIITAIKSLAFKTRYDQHSMGGVKHFITLFPHYFLTYSNLHLLRNCITKYYWIPILSLVITVFYIINKDLKKLVLFLCFMTGYLFLINISYPDNRTPDFYIENLYLPIGVFIALSFIVDILPLLNKKKLGMPIFLLIMGTGVIRIYTTRTLYVTRLQYEKRFLKLHQNNKLLIDTRKIPSDTLLVAWATPYEFWLLSTIEYHKTASIIVNDSVNNLHWASGFKDQFVTPWGVFPYSSLPRRYFRFADTATSYTVVQ